MDFVVMSRLEDLAILDPHLPDKRSVYKDENDSDDHFNYNYYNSKANNKFFECQVREQARLEELAKVSTESM